MATFIGVWKGKSVDEVHAWYSRLADLSAKNKKAAKIPNPLSPKFLHYYLSAPKKELNFSSPQHLKDSKYTRAALAEHRKIYLSQSQLKDKTKGLSPRISEEGSNGLTQSKTYEMSVHKLKEIPVQQFLSAREMMLILAGGDVPDDLYERIEKNMTPGDADLFTSLRSFQVESKVKVLVKPLGESKYEIKFTEFLAHVWDTYDFDIAKRLKLPNPDYNNQFQVKDPIALTSQMVMTYHVNLKELVKAGKAKPFKVKSDTWIVSDPSITKEATLTYP